MKNKLLGLVLIGLILSFNVITLADETSHIDAHSEQAIDNNQSYFTGNIEKMPQNENGKQKIKNHFTFFTINIVVNGKTEIINPDKK